MSYELDARVARRRAALALFAPPVEKPVLEPAPDVPAVHGVLRCQHNSRNCRVILIHEGEGPDGYAIKSLIFSVIDMDEKMVFKKAAEACLEWANAMPTENFLLFIEQKALRGAMDAIEHKLRNVIFTGKPSTHTREFNTHARDFNRQSTRVINKWLSGQPSTHGTKLKKAEIKTVPVSNYAGYPCSIYVEPWTDNGKRKMGIGYVIQEVAEGTESEGAWELKFGSFVSANSSGGSETLGALRAIDNALDKSGVLNDKIINKGQPLIVHSSDSEAVRILTVMLTTTGRKRMSKEIGGAELNAVLSIMKHQSRGAKMSFVTVGDYSAHPLSLAANRLGTAERRNNDMEMPLQLRENMREKIIKDAIEDLEKIDIQATALL